MRVYFLYIPKMNEMQSRVEMATDNDGWIVALLRNFLDALPLASIKPKRIMLQTGAKNYG